MDGRLWSCLLTSPRRGSSCSLCSSSSASPASPAPSSYRAHRVIPLVSTLACARKHMLGSGASLWHSQHVSPTCPPTIPSDAQRAATRRVAGRAAGANGGRYPARARTLLVAQILQPLGLARARCISRIFPADRQVAIDVVRTLLSSALGASRHPPPIAFAKRHNRFHSGGVWRGRMEIYSLTQPRVPDEVNTEEEERNQK